MDFDLDEARIARAMIDAAARTVVAADGSKLDARARVRVCRFEQVDTIAIVHRSGATLSKAAELMIELATRRIQSIAEPV